MHVDARELANNSIIEGDICIIGAGTAGISVALDWIDSPHKVILLESGGFEYDPKIQELSAGETTGQKYFPLQASRLRYFGGTTGHWAGMCSPMDDIDFTERDYVPHSGWPFGKKELDPFYEKAHATLGLGVYNYDYDYWKKENPDMEALPLDDKVIWNKMWQIKAARFGNRYKDTIVESKNIHLYTYACAVNLIANDGVSSITEVITKNHEGKTHKVRAKHFIMACGAIQNARLLLASNSQAQNGLGNEHDVVGRYFMEHLEIPSAELWLLNPLPSDLYSWGKIRAELAITPEVQMSNRILNGTAGLFPLSIGKHHKPRMETYQDSDPRKALKNTFDDGLLSKWLKLKTKIWDPTAYQLETRIEQAPNPNSRVTLGRERDALGVPKSDLHWELTALDKRSVRKIYEIIGQQIGISKLGRVKLMEFLQDETDTGFPENTTGGWHHMGTTRMNNDPTKGVVDANCKVHGISNLFVAGSACFATSGSPNPTLTLVALSLRLSNHVQAKLNHYGFSIHRF